MESDDESDTRSTRTLSTSSGGSDVEDLGTYSEDENSRRRRSSTLPASRRFSTATTANNSDNDDDDSYVLVGYPPVKEKKTSRRNSYVMVAKPRRLSAETGGFDEDFEDLTDDELNEAGYIPRHTSIPRISPQIRKKIRSREDNPQDPVPRPNPNSILAWREAKRLSQNNGHGSQQAKAYRDGIHQNQHTKASSSLPSSPRNSQSTHDLERENNNEDLGYEDDGQELNRTPPPSIGDKSTPFYFGGPRYASTKPKKIPTRIRDNSVTYYFNELPYTRSKNIPSQSSNSFRDGEDTPPPKPTAQERGYDSRSPPNPGTSLVDMDDGRLQAFSEASCGAPHPGLTTESRITRRGKYPVPLVRPPSSRPTRDQTYQTMTQYPQAHGPIQHHGSRLQPRSNNLRSVYQANDRAMQLPYRDNMDEMADDAEGRANLDQGMTAMEILDVIPSSDALSYRAAQRQQNRNRSRDSTSFQSSSSRGSARQSGRR